MTLIGTAKCKFIKQFFHLKYSFHLSDMARCYILNLIEMLLGRCV
jgi:hypothetical protein